MPGRMTPRYLEQSFAVVLAETNEIIARSGGVLLPHLRPCVHCRWLYPVAR